MTDELREIEESIALALADTYAGEPFRDSTFEQGTASVMAVVGPIVAERDCLRAKFAGHNWNEQHDGCRAQEMLGEAHEALRGLKYESVSDAARRVVAERDEAKGHVEMHMGHRLQIEAMVDEIIGTEPIEDVDGFVANVAYALRKLQDERDERFTSVVHQCCEDLQAIRASAVVLPEDWHQRVYEVLTSGETTISCAPDGLQVEMDGAVAVVVNLIESWRRTTTDAIRTTPTKAP